MDIDELVSRINGFSNISLPEKHRFINELIAIHPTLNLEWTGGHRFRRVRTLVSGEMLETVDDVIWRKGVPAKLGRANPEGYQVLYMSDRRDTALREARADHCWVVIAEFEIRDGHTIFICPIGEMYQIARTGRGFLAGDTSDAVSHMVNACPASEARSLLITDAFLYEQMVGHDDYAVSSFVAWTIFRKLSRVSAVAYSSRLQHGAVNLAVKVEGFWDDWGVRSVRRAFAEHLAFGFYKLSEITNVTGIYNDGAFQWANAVTNEEAIDLLDPPFFPAQV